MATNLPPFPPFVAHIDPLTVGARWKKWLSRFEIYLKAYKIDDPQQQVNLFMLYMGEETLDTLEALPGVTVGPATTFEFAKGKLSTHFDPTVAVNKEFEIYNFRSAKQEPTESVDQFYERLLKLSKSCNFASASHEIKSQIILTTTSSRLRRYALREEGTLESLLRQARSYETAERQASSIESSSKPDINIETLNAVAKYGKPNKKYHSSRPKSTPNLDATRPKSTSNLDTSKQLPEAKSCYFCGNAWPHEKGRSSCPANKVVCRTCQKIGHFQKLCHSRNKTEVTHNLATSQNGSSDEETFAITVSQVTTSSKVPRINIAVNGKPIKFAIDTGASVNVISEDILMKSGIGQSQLNQTDVKIYPYQSKTPLSVLGCFTATLSHKNATLTTNIFVVKGSADSLLGYESAVNLGLIQIATQLNSDYPSLYPQLFTGVGKLHDFKVHLHVDPTVPPVAQKHRRIPFHMRRKVAAEVARLEELDIIEPVSGPTPWVSPIVPVPKPRDPNAVRLCVDMRQANVAIKRERHITPTFDDLISSLNGATTFSKIDLKDGYHQLELDEASREITTFSTHVGLRRYKRLNFGINSAAEVFQNTIRQVLQGIEGVINISDDILVHGKSQEEHDRALHAVFTRLQEAGCTLNEKKCSFNQSELVFFGYKFSKNGIEPDPAKVKAFTALDSPKNASEVRSLLGMIQYCGKFIPNLATTTKPLRDLTHKDAEWEWSSRHQAALDQLKTQLSNHETLAYYDENKETHLIVDASPVGVAAILAQSDNAGNEDIVAYASRSLTEAEGRYSQIEREAVAVVFGMEHFHLYLFGTQFTVHTDHKPLLYIMGNPASSPSARIERLCLRLIPYRFTIVHKKGVDNPSDYMSRHPLEFTKSEYRTPKVPEEYIQFILRHATPKAMSLQEIEEATENDPLLMELQETLKSSNPEKAATSATLKQFKPIIHEITIAKGASKNILLKGTKIIIPKSLQNRTVELAHRGHLGIVKTKQLLREKVWFPNIDKTVEEAIQNCHPCQTTTKTKSRDPIQPTPLPQGPWQNLAVDFDGPYPNGKYIMLIIDEYSRYPITRHISSLKSETVIPHLRNIFSSFGIPNQLKSDNGPPFNGKEFANFANELNFTHHKVTPLWPEANGLAERGVRTIRKVILTAKVEGKDEKTELDAFLMNYRTTPHSTTGVSPYEALFGRKMKTSIPHFTTTSETNNVDTRIRLTDTLMKKRSKMYTDERRHTKNHTFKVGDTVLVRQPKINKYTPPFNPTPFKITKILGTKIYATQGQQVIVRNSSHFKRILTTTNCESNEAEEDEEEDWEAPETFDPDGEIFDPDGDPQPEIVEENPLPQRGPPQEVEQQRQPAERAPRYPQRQRQRPARLDDFVT